MIYIAKFLKIHPEKLNHQVIFALNFSAAQDIHVGC